MSHESSSLLLHAVPSAHCPTLLLCSLPPFFLQEERPATEAKGFDWAEKREEASRTVKETAAYLQVRGTRDTYPGWVLLKKTSKS
jgi:hypothetical protein